MPTAAGDPLGSSDSSNSESSSPDSGDDAPANQRASGHPVDPSKKDSGKEELKTELQRKRWGSRLGRLIWLFLAAMNLYLAYPVASMVT